MTPIWLCQKYIDEILNEFNIETPRKVLVAQEGLNKDLSILILDRYNHKEYFIHHAVMCTNPEMSYALNVMSIYQNDS